jgi:hypothetical protein
VLVEGEMSTPRDIHISRGATRFRPVPNIVQ